MTFLRKANDGNYYVCTVSNGMGSNRGKKAHHSFKNKWFVNCSQVISLKKVSFPKELIGKKVMFKVEVIEELN